MKWWGHFKWRFFYKGLTFFCLFVSVNFGGRTQEKIQLRLCFASGSLIFPWFSPCSLPCKWRNPFLLSGTLWRSESAILRCWSSFWLKSVLGRIIVCVCLKFYFSFFCLLTFYFILCFVLLFVMKLFGISVFIIYLKNNNFLFPVINVIPIHGI